MRNIDTSITFNGQTHTVELSRSFQQLYQEVALIFGIDGFVLKYRDEEGDPITMATDAELQHAFSSGNALHIEVFLSASAPSVQPTLVPAQAAAVQQPAFPQQPVYGHSAPQQPFLAAPQPPALYPTVQQYAMPGFQQPPQPVYGQSFPPQPVYGHPPAQPAYGQPFPHPIQSAYGEKQERKAYGIVDKAHRKMEKMNEKMNAKLDKQADRAARIDGRVHQRVDKLLARVDGISLAPNTPVQLSDINLVTVPQTAVFPPAPQSVFVKTPSGVFYSKAGPLPPSSQLPLIDSGVVPYLYSVEFLDPNRRVLLPGDHFEQRWRVRNEGTYAWPAGVMLVYDPCPKHGAAFFSGPNFLTIDHALGPKEEALISFRLVVPPIPGRYVGIWRLCTPDLWKFGQKIKIVVKAPTPDNLERAMQKAIRKASIPSDEKRALKAAKRAAKAEAKQAYREAKVVAKQSGDKDAKIAAKQACKEAKKQARSAHKEAKISRKQEIASVARATVAFSR